MILDSILSDIKMETQMYLIFTGLYNLSLVVYLCARKVSLSVS